MHSLSHSHPPYSTHNNASTHCFPTNLLLHSDITFSLIYIYFSVCVYITLTSLSPWVSLFFSNFPSYFLSGTALHSHIELLILRSSCKHCLFPFLCMITLHIPWQKSCSRSYSCLTPSTLLMSPMSYTVEYFELLDVTICITQRSILNCFDVTNEIHKCVLTFFFFWLHCHHISFLCVRVHTWICICMYIYTHIFVLFYSSIIVVGVKASGTPHVFKQWLEVSNGMLPVIYLCSNKSSFCVSQIFMEITWLSQRWGNSGHHQFFGILLDFKQWCLSVSICVVFVTLHSCFSIIVLLNVHCSLVHFRKGKRMNELN